MSSDGPQVERIGLLFVHGIGEQKRFEHLTGSVSQLAELFDRADARARISIVDRTADWTLPPGEPHPNGTPPMTLSVRSPDAWIDFDCHEVWWADLGSRSGIADVIGFWIWGLGQWGAPIYREIDASRLDKDDTSSANKVTTSLAKLPTGIVGHVLREPWARIRLMLAGVAALFAAVTWSLAKRLAGALLGQAPSPTLIVQYVGDVRTYTEGGGPGMGTPTDPGQPRRVGIRRRMVCEMVALASKSLDGWYVLSHSQGTVVAYNGLTEIGHTLPNYLTEAQWRGLPAAFQVDPGCRLRRDIENMMPSRPPWLEDEDVLNRPAMFANLRGLLTYGSPLGKYASLWPRIVATATDRVDKDESPFPKDCRWINFAAPHDPVAGFLAKFFPTAEDNDFLRNAIPRIEDVRTPLGLDFVLAHIRYLSGYERFAHGTGVVQKAMLARWLLGDGLAVPSTASGRRAVTVRSVGLFIGYTTLILALWAATVLTFTGLRAGIWAISPGGASTWYEAVCRFLRAASHCTWPVLGTALSIITLCGLWRWWRESRHNLRLARADRAADPGNLESYWRKVIGMVTAHVWGAGAFFLVSTILCTGALLRDWRHALACEAQVGPSGAAAGLSRQVAQFHDVVSATATLFSPWRGIGPVVGAWLSTCEDYRAAFVALASVVLASLTQALVNRTVPAAVPN